MAKIEYPGINDLLKAQESNQDDSGNDYREISEQDNPNVVIQENGQTVDVAALLSNTVEVSGMGAPKDSKAMAAILAFAGRAEEYAALANMMDSKTVTIGGLGTKSKKLLAAIQAHANQNAQSAGRWTSGVKNNSRGGGMGIA